MQQALDLAKKGLNSTSPNPRVGCVITQAEQVVGEGFHVIAGSAHAEVHALRQAGPLATNATAYVTLEPCSHYGRTPPCALALIEAKVKEVIIATLDPNPLVAGKGKALLTQAGITVKHGLLEESARILNRGFFSRIERNRPFVQLKCATSLDGKTALNNGQSQWITSEASRLAVQHLRAKSCAILTGVGTVLKDNPTLNVRAFHTLRQPKRIVVDTHLRTPLDSHIVQQNGGQTFIATSVLDQTKHQPYLDQGVQMIKVPLKQNHIDLLFLMEKLADLEIGELMVEAGQTLNSALLQAQLIDEIVWFQAPKILGSHAQGAFSYQQELTNLISASQWQITQVNTIENDICLYLHPKN
ncbi:bifunctional diaminohydroxyphosphoribosylaminopyrimidine deaminase/5-amino-6-(5-phosphoribosylamino)uracil reductase RibD [Neisseria sp. Ec49-e6-T10]|uniref:bifunctional diaminohydroxyphosphoribosylaminopyrimidine deaminase/5-amino-6-(5-phosphoribosylamino)uracil reductase RibD n=1 Tax=Neisseria sp. Ec49-e6-T10 TaxID=3140744 RepID=UPI003EC0BC4A